MRSTMASVCAFGVLALATPARGDVPEPTTGTTQVIDPYETMPLLERHEPHTVRAVLEIGTVLGVGLVDYMLNTAARGGKLRPGELKWGLRYDWPTLREKLIGTGLNLDTNKLATNYASHPFAGTLYYSAARTNHLSFAESGFLAVLGSTTWEYFGEIREITSVNDLIVTPVSGIAIGEATTQLSAFFQHGAPTQTSGALSFLASPVNAVNTWTDEAKPLRARTDDLGLSTATWHRFDVKVGLAQTTQESTLPSRPRATYLDELVDVDLRLVHLPGYSGAGHEARLYDDGNVSSIHVGFTRSEGRIVNGIFDTRIVPIGFYARDARASSTGVEGQGITVGLRMGFEHGAHTYDRDGGRPHDVWSAASPLGIAAEHVWSRPPLELRSYVDVFAGIGGVTPYALTDWRRQHDDRGLLTPIREQGYYHGLITSLAPGVELRCGPVSLSAEARFDDVRAIEGLDENEPQIDDGLRIHDRRATASGAAGVTIPTTRVRLGVEARRSERSGTIGDVTVRRAEVALAAYVGIRL